MRCSIRAMAVEVLAKVGVLLGLFEAALSLPVAVHAKINVSLC